MAKEAAESRAHSVPDEADQPPTSDQEVHRAKDDRHIAVDQGPRPGEPSLSPPGGHRLQEKDAVEGPQGHGSALLLAAHWPCGDWVLLARQDDWPPATGVGQVLVVQLQEEADALPPLHGVPGLDPPRYGGCGQEWEGTASGSTGGRRLCGGCGGRRP